MFGAELTLAYALATNEPRWLDDPVGVDPPVRVELRVETRWRPGDGRWDVRVDPYLLASTRHGLELVRGGVALSAGRWWGPLAVELYHRSEHDVDHTAAHYLNASGARLRWRLQ